MKYLFITHSYGNRDGACDKLTELGLAAHYLTVSVNHIIMPAKHLSEEELMIISLSFDSCEIVDINQGVIE
jgi:hypothetical protein